MKCIENSRNKYKGKEIWILGTGPSLDDYPEDFFDDKVSIALKWTGMIFTNCIYNMSSLREPQILKFLKMNPELFKKHIFTWHKDGPHWLGKYLNIPTYVWTKRFRRMQPDKDAMSVKEIKHEFIKAVDCIKRKKESYHYTTMDTILHIAIQVAAVLGAKKISIVGCEDKCTPESCYAKSMEAYYDGKAVLGKWDPGRIKREFPVGEGYLPERIEKIWNCKAWTRNRRATRWLAARLKHYGVEVTLYHHKNSEQYETGYLKLA